MQIKKRYIKEEIERLEKIEERYLMLSEDVQVPYSRKLNQIQGKIDALTWVLGFADD